MQKEVIENLIQGDLEKWPELFLVDLQIQQDNTIKIVLDGDHSVSLQDCANISRGLEQNLDREEEDFSLEVTSAGLTTPLGLPRQFKKNIGRKLKIKTDKEKYKATLTSADDKGIQLQWKQREPKPIGKGKHTVEKSLELAYSQIKSAKVMITFN